MLIFVLRGVWEETVVTVEEVVVAVVCFTGLATSWHHFTWPPPQHQATQNPRASFSFDDGFDHDNFHADHHILHAANFGDGFAPLLDFYFGTAGDTPSAQINVL